MKKKKDLMKAEEAKEFTEKKEEGGGVMPECEPKITKADVERAEKLMREYKRGKANLEQRIIDNDIWWKMRHWEQIRDKNRKYNPVSAWLFNSMANKHADAMDNLPEGIVLPREQSDGDAADMLSAILPVVLEQNDFEEIYSDVWYDKLKGGTGVYGIFWDPSKAGGCGDVVITRCDILNLFWEPGISDIQKSRNLFHVELADNDLLAAQYPLLADKLGGSNFTVASYKTDDAIDTSGKTPVVDWYYKVNCDGRELVHYCKFCCGEILFASENELEYASRGFYDHGLYPFVFDRLFIEQGSPCGFGFIDIMKDSQTQIDLIGASVAENIRMASKVRYFARGDGSINEKEFADWNNPIVHYTGSGNPEENVTPIVVPPLSGACLNYLDRKINELKETSGNRDFSQGGTTAGVTAASAIAALQESGSKLSRDIIRGSYRAFVRINNMVIELIRQFYNVPRCFRITAPNGEMSFASYSNELLMPQSLGGEFGVDLGSRLPVFDIKVKAQKQNPYSRLTQNELAKEFYKLGFFDPNAADQAIICIGMMDFEGKDEILRKIKENRDRAAMGGDVL